MRCFHVSDLHGREARYERLFALARDERPEAILIGGDFLPNAFGRGEEFVESYLAPALRSLAWDLGAQRPRVFLICGNDDPRAALDPVEELEREGLLEILNERSVALGDWHFFGYPYVPPTPFRLKDWERYDVGRHVEPGCISPEDGVRTVPVEPMTVKYGTIRSDLERLTSGIDVARTIWLFHGPPYRTTLDRAALDGQSVDHAPLDVHVGSVAIRRFIEERQPRVSLHGHIHESARLTGHWRDRIGGTHLFGAAHDGPELALVRFDPDDPDAAIRFLIPVS